jgi:Fic family protein
MKYPIKATLNKRVAATSPTLNAMLSQIDQLRGQWTGGVNLAPQILGRLKKSALITSAGSSTRIEGSKLSDQEIEDIIKGTKFDRMKDRDSQEVHGYYETLSFIFENYDNIPISENYILELHNRLLRYTDKDTRHRGVYKKLENSVKLYGPDGAELAVLFDTTPPHLVSGQMQTLVDWYNDEINDYNFHPLLVIAGFVIEFLRIHPFQDGNGRLSRLLTNMLMLQNGFSYVPYVSNEKIVEENKAEYYLALRYSQKTFGAKSETIEPWIEFFLRVCLAQVEQAVGLLTGENIEKTLSPKQLVVWEYVKKVGEASVKAVAAATDVGRPTVKQSLDKLLELKLIERIGAGRATRYRILDISH